MTEQLEAGERPSEDRSMFRCALRRVFAGGTASLVVTAPLKAVGVLPIVVVVRIAAVATILVACVYALRTEIHAESMLRYGVKGRAHAGVVAAECVAAIALFACGPLLIMHPSSAAQFASATTLAVVVLALGVGMSSLIDHAGVSSASEAARHCVLIRAFRAEVLDRLDHVWFVRRLNELLDREPPAGRVSYFVLWIFVVLMMVASANTPTVAPAVYKLLRGHTASVVHAGSGSASAPSGSGAVAASNVSPGAGVYAPVTVSAQAAPTYDELCPQGVTPGDPAPEPIHSELYRQWLQPGGLGAAIAGCANTAHEQSNGVWFAAGTCDGELRSLAVAGPGVVPGMLLWAPARFALQQALRGTLTGASSSRLVGSGEVYAVQTSVGTYAFLRDRLNDVGVGLRAEPRHCAEAHRGAVPYVMLPPALTRLWSAQVQADDQWLWPERDGRAGTWRYVFHAANPGDDRTIVGSCATDTDCELRVDGIASNSTGAGGVSLDALLARFAVPAGS